MHLSSSPPTPSTVFSLSLLFSSLLFSYSWFTHLFVLPLNTYPSSLYFLPLSITLSSLSLLHYLTNKHTLSAILKMSSRRSRSSRQTGGGSGISDDQIAELVHKLQQLIPEIRGRRNSDKSANRVLQETCNYIRNLHREVDDLSDRLAELLASTDSDSAQAAIIRSLLM